MHIGDRCTCTHAHTDAAAGVTGIADWCQAAVKLGSILAQHVFIHAEPAGTEDYAFSRSHVLLFLVDAHHDANDFAFIALNQGQCPGFVMNVNRRALFHRVSKNFHQQRAAVVALYFKVVSAGHGFCLLVEGVGFFIAGKQQAVIGQGHNGAPF